MDIKKVFETCKNRGWFDKYLDNWQELQYSLEEVAKRFSKHKKEDFHVFVYSGNWLEEECMENFKWHLKNYPIFEEGD